MHNVQVVVDETRKIINGNYVVGSTRFQEQIVQALGRKVTKVKGRMPNKNRGEQ